VASGALSIHRSFADMPGFRALGHQVLDFFYRFNGHDGQVFDKDAFIFVLLKL
jgi:hypothetical protein